MNTTLFFIHPGKTQKKITLRQTEKRRVFFVFVLKNTQKAWLRIIINQKNPESFCQTRIVGVVSDQAQIEIEGINKVEEGAFGTKSLLEERVLLVGEKARATLKPFLEMANGKIKVKHAAAAGRIDPKERFYLQSRGVQKEKAEKLLAYFFLKDVINQIKEKNKKEKIKNYIQARL